MKRDKSIGWITRITQKLLFNDTKSREDFYMIAIKPITLRNTKIINDNLKNQKINFFEGKTFIYIILRFTLQFVFDIVLML